ncbi:MAG: adenosylmethionine--8-amino-7-oxononanoate transaminase [Deltaproteobacteria bacterium]|nr:adenosylmethionine--8-amino-7-oxononanoate transaminase [Deltaproteobacteria bacterium]HCH61471.1 adenosylmethionine--8-amino-7-oxononanoate transaminase [Deltaproteobacteria bacterium]
MPQWLHDGLRHVWQPYTQHQTAPLPAPVVAARESRIQLASGRWLIDGVASWWTAVHGHAHPHLTAAVHAQLDRLPHVMFGSVAHEPASTLACRLAQLLPGDLDHVFFAESGSVSVEVAMKMAVQYHLNQGERRTRFLGFHHGYHGDTLATMSVCDPDRSMHAHFAGFLPAQLHAALPTDSASLTALERLLEAHHTSLAGIMVEPLVQGAGGFRMHGPEALQHLRRLCDRYGLLLIFDEIATGFGRTGSMFACEQAGVVPDILTLSKALTGGVMPLSCAVARTPIFEAFQSQRADHALMHGPTFMANPLACAAANASLDLFETEPRLEQARALEAWFTEDLRGVETMPGVVEVRVKGAVAVIEVEALASQAELMRIGMAQGVWLRPFGGCIYATPPLVLSRAEAGQVAGAMRSMAEACDPARRL